MPTAYDNPDFDMMPRPEHEGPRFPWWTRPRLIALVTVIGLLLRLWAAWQLPVDADEPVYLQAAYDYAHLVQQGDLGGVINYLENSEHPPLGKLLYAGVLLLMGGEPGSGPVMLLTRLVSVFFGTLSVLVVALIDPLAGFFLAVQTLAVKYTSEVYLEALPQFASILSVAALLRSRQPGDRWFWLSAGGLGLAAAGKFSYFPILAPLIYIAVREKKFPWPRLGLYLLAAAGVFLALDPALWPDPLGRLAAALTFHAQYSQSAHVQSSGYGWFQPILWVAQSWGYAWHPSVFMYYGIDSLIFVLGVIGAYLERKPRPWLAVWLLTSMLFLMLWPTRWPQYTLVLIPAICLAAAPALRAAWAWVSQQESTWGWFGAMIPRVSRPLRIGLGVGVVVLLVVYLVYYAWLGGQRRMWTHLTNQNSPLPSNSVYDIEPLADGKMALATTQGLAIWSPPQAGVLETNWEVFTPENSGLTYRSVMAVALAPDGALWIGTTGGVDVYDLDTRQWSSGRLPLVAQVNDLAITAHGQVWFVTDQGAAVYNNGDWSLYTPFNSPLAEEFIFSVAVQPSGPGEVIWLGTGKGVYRFNTASGIWDSLSNSEMGLGVGGISDIMLDGQGRVWVASLGGGLAVWDGREWQPYRLDNSDLPGSVIQSIFPSADGGIWAAVSYPTTAGGIAVRLDGDHWIVYRPNTSGYSGSETLDITADSRGRVWFGTISAGVDVFDQGRK